MLRLPASVRVFIATRPIVPTGGVDILLERVRSSSDLDPFSGDLFCFFDRYGTQVKLLTWDMNGFWVFAKRLERGRFPRFDQRKHWLEITREEFVMLMAGINPRTLRYNRDYVREVSIESRADDERSRTP